MNSSLPIRNLVMEEWVKLYGDYKKKRIKKYVLDYK